MDIILTGFFVVIITISLSKVLIEYKNYRGTIYSVIYSGFIEYLTQLRIKKDMSKSKWLTQEVGTHRILFNSYLDENKKGVYNYITIFSKYGIFVFSVLNSVGQIKGKDKDKYWLLNKNDKNYRVINPTIMLDKHIEYIKEVTDYNNISGNILFPNKTNFKETKSKYLISNYSDVLSIIKSGNDAIEDADIENMFNKCIKKYGDSK